MIYKYVSLTLNCSYSLQKTFVKETWLDVASCYRLCFCSFALFVLCDCIRAINFLTKILYLFIILTFGPLQNQPLFGPVQVCSRPVSSECCRLSSSEVNRAASLSVRAAEQVVIRE